LARSAAAIALYTETELGLAADNGFVDFDHPREAASDFVPIVHQLGDGVAEFPRRLLVHPKDARNYHR
jgi:hypothetical protein